ncbi:MAG: restriction endonuclease subunit S [Deltaproteobacteria bacterium]|nr:restriction endonuclease subunit S [Deltaproteobacteria bacterium]
MKKILLSNIISSLESGSRPKGGVSTTSGDIPSLGAEHLNDQGGFNFTNLKLIPHNFYKSLKKGRLKPNDILIVKDGATTGKVSFVNEHFPHTDAAINEHLFRVEIDKRKADPSFVFRFLNSGLGQHQILKDFRGATVGGISRGFIEKVDIPYPSITEQKRIAAILDKADAIRRRRQQAIQLSDELLKRGGKKFVSEMFVNPV